MRKYLMTPGPSPVPLSIREKLSDEIIHHRTDEFRAIVKEVKEGLQYCFCTKNPVLIFASSGTGAMQAAVNNFFSPGDKVIAICGGKFGERWAEIAQSFGLSVLRHEIPWEESPSLCDLAKIVEREKDIKGVFTALTETSTGTVYDIKGLGEVLRGKDILFVVDAISGLGQDILLPDAWGVDVVVSGSQKGFMLPPGLGFLSVSERGKNFLKSSKLPKYYLDLRKYLKSYDKDDTPFTPSISLIRGLKESIRLMKNEGIQKRWERFRKLSSATRKAAQALNLAIFSKNPSFSLTAVVSPGGIQSSEIVKKLRKDYGVSIAGGQGKLKDKIFRIAHMGSINEQDLLACFSLLEKVLKDLGHSFPAGGSLVCLEKDFYG